MADTDKFLADNPKTSLQGFPISLRFGSHHPAAWGEFLVIVAKSLPLGAVHLGLVGTLLVGAPAYSATLDLSNFVLFAGTGPLSLGGGSTVSSGAVGTGGNLNTGNNVTVKDLAAGGNISVGGGSTVSSGSGVIAGGNLSTGNSTQLNGVNVTLGGTNTFGGGTTAPASLATNVTPAPFSGASSVQLPTLPADGIAAPSTQASGAVVNPAINTATNLAPGQYGALSLGGGGTLNLTSGTYHFTSFNVGNNFNINYDLTGGAINILIDGNAMLSGGTHWNLTNGDASDVYWELNGNFTTGNNVNIYGTVFTANGGIANLGDNLTLDGGGLFVGQFLATGGITTGNNMQFSFVQNDRFAGPAGGPGQAETPIPAALPLFGTGLGFVAWLAKRKKRKAAA